MFNYDRGTFEERQVAVKRILPECFEMADHEVPFKKNIYLLLLFRLLYSGTQMNTLM